MEQLESVIAAMRACGAIQIHAKLLAENDNSKQQVYFGNSFEALSIFPFRSIEARHGTKDVTYWAPLGFNWMDSSGTLFPAPNAKLILYPGYPEVRLSGFLQGAIWSPNEHLQQIPSQMRRHNNQPDGRVLLFGIRKDDVICFLAPKASPISDEIFDSLDRFEQGGVFFRLDVGWGGSRAMLMKKLSEIASGGWQDACRLNASGERVPYHARNAGGYTLEALFGILPNGVPLPDYLEWELKAFSGSSITLMTPEPDGGFYGDYGVKEFVERYATSRSNEYARFTGVHYYGVRHQATKLVLRVSGFEESKIVDASGSVTLLDERDRTAASWSFAKLIEHWVAKHSAVAFVPYVKSKTEPVQYSFPGPVGFGEGTKFERFLSQLCAGRVKFDPAPKITYGATGTASVKARSQFRSSYRTVPNLYSKFEIITLGT